MNKQDIRRMMRARKTLLTDRERQQGATDVFTILEKSAAFLLAEHVLMYHSLPDELSTIDFLNKWGTRKHFYLPRVNGADLEILPYDRSHLRLGAFQIEEPDGSDVVSFDTIDMVVVPGVAFDRNGNRLGRGKGFYDRLLSGCRATKVGVGYGFQLVDEIDSEPHDVKMDVIIAGGNTLIIRHKQN